MVAVITTKCTFKIYIYGFPPGSNSHSGIPGEGAIS